PKQRATLNVVLRRGGTIRGSVHYNGKPFTDADVIYEDNKGQHRGATPIDSDGRYELQGVPAGPVTLRVRDRIIRGIPLPTAQMVIEVGKESQHDFDWSETLASIRGQVVDSRGKPISSQLVIARPHKEQRRRFQTNTDSGGLFEVSVLPEDSYDI